MGHPQGRRHGFEGGEGNFVSEKKIAALLLTNADTNVSQNKFGFMTVV